MQKDFFDEITSENLNLIIHELGHENGLHVESSYHQLLSELGAKLIIKALINPEYFEL